MKPKLKLVGEDGNAFSILGRARRASRGLWTTAEWEEFQREATSSNYAHLLQTVCEYFEVEGEEEL